MIPQSGIAISRCGGSVCLCLLCVCLAVYLLSFNCTLSGSEAPPNRDSNKFAIVIFEYCFIYSPTAMLCCVHACGAVHIHVGSLVALVDINIYGHTHVRGE